MTLLSLYVGLFVARSTIADKCDEGHTDGLFARVDIAKGEVLAVFVGEPTTAEVADDIQKKMDSFALLTDMSLKPGEPPAVFVVKRETNPIGYYFNQYWPSDHPQDSSACVNVTIYNVSSDGHFEFHLAALKDIKASRDKPVELFG